MMDPYQINTEILLFVIKCIAYLTTAASRWLTTFHLVAGEYPAQKRRLDPATEIKNLVYYKSDYFYI